jgi:glycosyltransferase involved in cell wall biosynthesis
MIPEGDALLRSIGVQNAQRFFVYMADTHRPQAGRASVNDRLRVLNSARLNWGAVLPLGFSSQDNKGTDTLLRGFAQFIQQDGNAELRLVRKGLRVKETEELIRSLKIDDFVVWLEEMSLAEYYDELDRADVVCDQLGTSFPGMAGLDAMVTSKPVLANFRLDVLQKHFPAPWPVLHATTAEDVCRHLRELGRSASRRQEVGDAARTFAMKYLSPEINAKMCLERLGVRHSGQ